MRLSILSKSVWESNRIEMEAGDGKHTTCAWYIAVGLVLMKAMECDSNC